MVYGNCSIDYRGKKSIVNKEKGILVQAIFRTVSCDQKYCKCMKAEQP